MMEIEVTIPGMLRHTVNGQTRFKIEAETIANALNVIQRDFPLLRPHVWTDAGQLRQHVLLFHNDNGLKWMNNLNVPLKAGDRIQIVQAVSGG